jgi:hypothetical protein
VPRPVVATQYRYASVSAHGRILVALDNGWCFLDGRFTLSAVSANSDRGSFFGSDGVNLTHRDGRCYNGALSIAPTVPNEIGRPRST